MPLESTITKNIINLIKEKGGMAEKIHGNAMSIGRPDINACYKGRCLRLEVKSPDHNNQASQAQLINLAKWERAGAVSKVVRSVKEVKEILDEILETSN